jgi:hypothetical protein
MAPEIKESDWKVFRRLHQVALDRFCRRVIEELRAATSHCGDNYHKCYLHIFKIIRRRDKELGIAFDDPRRSSAFILLANIYQMGLLTNEELAEFSPEMRERLEALDRVRGA